MAIDANIRGIIKNHGYITMDDMMREISSSNTKSYYISTKNIGQKGDFITSPEISQLFGEMIGLWVIEQWKKIRSPKKFTLLELGPGQGKMMRDVMRTMKLNPIMLKACDIFLYEINPFFIQKQKKSLDNIENKIEWIQKLEDLPDQPIIVISNEFFDALPIKQYKKIKHEWYEVVLIIDPVDGRIKFDTISINRNLQKFFAHEHPNAKDGAVFEESIESLDIVRFLSKKIVNYTGAFLAIDYGYDIETKARKTSQYNSTLQAIAHHSFQPVIESLGQADISAHVDFNAIKKVAVEKFISFKNQTLITQAEFLIQYGILLRLRMLQDINSIEISEILGKQVHRLISKDQMGELFKVFLMN